MRQLCQWNRLAHNRLQSFSTSEGIPVFEPKIDCRDDLVEILSSILITIVIDRTWFTKHVQCISTVGVVFTFTIHSSWENKRRAVCLLLSFETNFF